MSFRPDLTDASGRPPTDLRKKRRRPTDFGAAVRHSRLCDPPLWVSEDMQLLGHRRRTVSFFIQIVASDLTVLVLKIPNTFSGSDPNHEN